MKDSGRSPVVAENPEGRGPFVILCDHASNRIPEAYQSFGFAEDALQTHIAWDPGALAVTRLLSAKLDAPLFWPDASRLIIDCNRAADAPSLIVTESEGCPVPANRVLSEEERSRRLANIHAPFHDAIDTAYDLAGLMKSAIPAWLAARLIQGSAHPREGAARLFYTSRVNPTTAHIVDQHMEVAG